MSKSQEQNYIWKAVKRTSSYPPWGVGACQSTIFENSFSHFKLWTHLGRPPFLKSFALTSIWARSASFWATLTIKYSKNISLIRKIDWRVLHGRVRGCARRNRVPAHCYVENYNPPGFSLLSLFACAHIVRANWFFCHKHESCLLINLCEVSVTNSSLSFLQSRIQVVVEQYLNLNIKQGSISTYRIDD